jgi:ligand-binding sensor domain-containing protein
MRQYRSVIKTNKFPQLTRRVFTTADGLKSDNVTAMRFDNNGVLFVGTDKGLARFDGEKFSPIAIGAKDAAISMIYFNAENHMFIGVGNSMLEFDGKKKISEKKFSSKLIDIKVDLDGATWILTESVLYKLGENGYDIEIGVPGKGSCLAVYKNNKVYVGTAGGMLSSASAGTGRSSWRVLPEFSATQLPAFTWIPSAAFGSARTGAFVSMTTTAIGWIIQKSTVCPMLT